MVIAGPRIYYAMAHDRLFPRAIAKVHPRFGTPANAILLQAVWSIVLVFSGRFEQLLMFSGVVLILFSVLTVAAVYVIRRRGDIAGYRSWGYPWTMLIFLAASAWILAVSFANQPKESFAGLAVVAAGVPFYYYWNRRRRLEEP
jgi:APA family basic amino acid/polyamine antiporter